MSKTARLWLFAGNAFLAGLCAGRGFIWPAMLNLVCVVWYIADKDRQFTDP